MHKSQIKPLVSEQTAPTSVQFRHFGVLDDGKRSKKSIFTSVLVNILIAFVVIIIGAAAKKTIANNKLTNISLAPQPKEPEKPKPPKPVIKVPPPQEIAKLEPPKIMIEQPKLPDIPKPPEIKITPPMPVIPPSPPKLATAPAAPAVVSLKPMAAAVTNNAPHPTAIRAGQTDNPIKAGPSVSAVNIGLAGAPGMNSANAGLGPAKVSVGSGSPNSSSTTGNGVMAVRDVKAGVVGGTGALTNRVAGPVNVGSPAAVAVRAPPPQPVATGSPIKVLYKPTPEYTAEARANHIEGNVSVHIHVSAGGAVQVIGVVKDLGYGLGASAVRAAQNMRVQPATDTTGHPIDWDGIVMVSFQIAG